MAEIEQMGRALIILGAGGNAFDVLDIVEALSVLGQTHAVAGFLDDSQPVGAQYAGLPILGGLAEAKNFPQHAFISTIRNEKTFRISQEILAKTGLSSDRFVTLVHPTAGVSSHAQLGCGVYVANCASVAGGVILGNHVSVGPGCIVGHGSVIGDHTILAPGSIISGEVRVEKCVYVGAGSVVRQHLHVGEKSLIGMGAVVIRDVEVETTVVGNPAHPIVPRTVTPDDRRKQCYQTH
jgi:sugar O-acyltransferase (sialic acid O-acetyltransferase NeuD family)